MTENVPALMEQTSHTPATVDELHAHVAIVDAIKSKVMKKGLHYGEIPGTGGKPTLLKAGAEKIALTFRLSHDIDVQYEAESDGHRTYTAKVRLKYRDGTPVGEGIGICSTLEGRYRFRWDNTGKAVPKDYWNNRDSDLLGGPAYTARKVGQQWMIFRRVEHDAAADYYNTAAKMAKKRALVDAVLSATAASDAFEQDRDDDPPPANDTPNAAPPADSVATDAQLSILREQLGDSGKDEKKFLAAFDLEALEDLRFNQVNSALQWLKAKV